VKGGYRVGIGWYRGGGVREQGQRMGRKGEEGAKGGRRGGGRDGRVLHEAAVV
jgi:hypothetical protein